MRHTRCIARPRSGATRTAWLLITISTGPSSTLRVQVWRRLRSLGALYLQQSVCLLPERPEVVSAVARLIDRVNRDGGEGRVLRIGLLDADAERAIIEASQRERDDEYAAFVSRTPAFLDEISMERGQGRATYLEVEESAADLERLGKWLAKIRARDYFGAPEAMEAKAALARSATALAELEAEALAVQAPGLAPPASGRDALRIVKGA